MFGAVVKRAANPRLVQNAALWNKVPTRNIYPQASSNHIAGLPRNRFPFAEKMAGGVFFAVCVLTIPAWIVTHMDDYRGGPPSEN